MRIADEELSVAGHTAPILQFSLCNFRYEKGLFPAGPNVLRLS